MRRVGSSSGLVPANQLPREWRRLSNHHTNARNSCLDRHAPILDARSETAHRRIDRMTSSAPYSAHGYQKDMESRSWCVSLLPSSNSCLTNHRHQFHYTKSSGRDFISLCTAIPPVDAGLRYHDITCWMWRPPGFRAELSFTTQPPIAHHRISIRFSAILQNKHSPAWHVYVLLMKLCKLDHHLGVDGTTLSN